MNKEPMNGVATLGIILDKKQVFEITGF